MYEALIASQEAEQSKIGRDLHDQTSPFLSSIQKFMEVNPSSDDDLYRLLNASITGIRSAYHNLSPPGLLDNSLEYAVRFLVTNVFESSNIKFDVDFQPSGIQYSQVGSLHLYRIISELTSNAVKYAKCSRISIKVNTGPRELVIEVLDNGVGMDVDNSVYSEGLGWQSINNRLAILNGTKEIESSSGGTSISINIPTNSIY